MNRRRHTILNSSRNFTSFIILNRPHFGLTRFGTRAASFRLVISTPNMFSSTINTVTNRITNTMRTLTTTRQANSGALNNRQHTAVMTANRTFTTRMRLANRPSQRQHRLNIRGMNTSINGQLTSQRRIVPLVRTHPINRISNHFNQPMGIMRPNIQRLNRRLLLNISLRHFTATGSTNRTNTHNGYQILSRRLRRQQRRVRHNSLLHTSRFSRLHQVTVHAKHHSRRNHTNRR